MSEDIKPIETTTPEVELTSTTVESVLDSTEVKEAIAKAVSDATQGVIDNRDAILREKRELADKLKSIDVDDYQKLKTEKQELEDAKLKEAGEYETLLQKNISDLESKYTTQLDLTVKRAEEAETSLTTLRESAKMKSVSDAIKNAALAAGITDPNALDDVSTKGSQVFAVNELGELEARDIAGVLITDSAGKLLSPESYLQSLKATNGYFWGQAKSAGLEGSRPAAVKTDINAQLAAAAEAGDMALYSKLRAKAK